MDLSLLNMNALLVFLLLLLRMTGMIVAAPFFTQTGVPMQVQVGIAVTVTFILYPMIADSAHVGAQNLGSFALIAAMEFIIGLLLGFLVNMLFAAIQLAGNHVTNQMGLGVAQTIDPVSQQQTPVMGQFYFILAITLFLSLNMHHQLILAVAKSLEVIPLASGGIHLSSLTARMMQHGEDVFILSLMLIVPVMGIMLVQDVALAFMSKIMPQMNIFMVSLPLKVAVALVLIYTTLPFTTDRLTVAFHDVTQHLQHLFSP